MSKASESKGTKKVDKKKADKPKRVTGQNAGPQGFLVEHGEKVGFGLFGLIVVLCAVGALTRESYTKTPEQLAASLKQKSDAVSKNTPASYEPLRKLELTPFVSNPPDPLQIPATDGIAFIGTPDPDYRVTRRRGEPMYLGIENLRAYPFNEALAMLGASGKKASPKKQPPKEAKSAPKKKDDLLSQPGVSLGKGKKGGAVMPKKESTAKKEPAAKAPDQVAGGASAAPKWTPPQGGVDAPGADAKAFSGVLVVGTIPKKKQDELYQREFETARDYTPSRDTSHYVGILIQRSQDGGQTWEDKVTVQTPKGPKEMTFLEAYWEISQKFAAEFPEIVDTSLGEYIVPFAVNEKKADEDLPIRGFAAQPLPPILARDWDEIVAGGFPVRKAEAQGQPAGFPGAQPGRPGAATPGGPGPGGPGPGGPGPMGPGAGGPPGAGPKINLGQPGESPGGPPGGVIRKQVRGPGSGGLGGLKQPPGVGPAVGMPAPSGVGSQPKSGVGLSPVGPPGAGPTGPARGGPGPPGVGPGTIGSGPMPSGVNPFAKSRPQQSVPDSGAASYGQVQDPNCDLLFRFFDLTAEEGKSYQYRVALQLENANYGLAEGLLSKPELRKPKYRYSAPSAPTAAVRISIAGGDVVAGVVRGARPEAGVVESATVVLRQRHRQNGALVTHMFTRLEAGQMLNFKAQSVKYAKAVGGVETTPLPDFDFQTDELLLDLKGGGDRGAPGEILFLDASGKLSLKSEAPGPAGSVKAQGGQFADESKRLEYIYNYTAPSSGGATPGGQPSFDDLLKPTK